MRHPKNSRRQDKVLQNYVRSVQTRGVIPGVRGEAWLVAPSTESGCYLALTFGTLSDAFYAAYERDDRTNYPNLLATAQAGLDAIVFDYRTPNSILDFMILVWTQQCNSFHTTALALPAHRWWVYVMWHYSTYLNKIYIMLSDYQPWLPATSFACWTQLIIWSLINTSQLRITYHNQFHKGSTTSFVEMMLKIPDVPCRCLPFARCK